MAHRARITKDTSFENDVVLQDIHAHFKDEDFTHEKKDSFFQRHIARKIFIAVLILMAVLYILARLHL